MHKLLTLGLAGLFLVVTGCQDTNTTGPLAGPSFHEGGDGGDEGNFKEIEIQDKCEPESFNAAIGPGTCVGDEDVTFAEFLEELNPDDGGHGAWRFHPGETHIDEGEGLVAENEGGEFHTFTEVLAFGGGCIDDLNIPLELSPVPECLSLVEVAPGVFVPEAFLTTGVDPGGSSTLAGLSVGTHRFQCLIHPWMRLELEVRADD